MMNIDDIKHRLAERKYVFSLHAELRRKSANLTFAQVREALLNGVILEQYPDTGRGVSCLILGFAHTLPIHVVAAWLGDQVVIVTVYIPGPPKFVDPWTRGGQADDS